MAYDKKFLIPDVMITITCILFISVHIITNFYIANQVQITKADYQMVAQAIEGNPVSKWTISLAGLTQIFRWIIIPAIVLGIYATARLRKDYIQASYLATLMLAAAVLNITNDLSMYLGSLR